jgi:transposase-like protein
MITVEEREAIRRAYYLEGKSKRQIAREHSHSRKTVDKAVDNQPPKQHYTGHKIYELLQAEGYQGSEARVRLHMTQWNKQ